MNGVAVKEFLSDMEEFAQVECLEEGTEKNELLESARKRGILVDPDFGDLGVIKTIFGFTDKPSVNGQIVVEEKLLKVLPQIVGRPMNKNHISKFILGSYIDFKYIAKKKQVIAYATFYRSVYPQLWERAKLLRKAGKLSSSFEIFAPKRLRKYVDEKNFELNGMAMIGGALVFEDEGEIPAFRDAKVLEMACDMKGLLSEDCIEYATKYDREDVIIASTELMPAPAPVATPISTVTCQNCKTAFTPGTLGELKLTCPTCKSIVSPAGVVLLPPQIKDYKLSCPGCNGDFTILTNEKDTQNVQCNGCGKKYKLTFYSSEKPDAMQMVNLLYETEVHCPQCGAVKAVDTFYDSEPFETDCRKCGIKFPVDIKMKVNRKIKEIKLINEEPKNTELEDEELEKATLIKGIKKLANEIMTLKKKAKEKAETFACECIKCGNKENSAEHCKDLKCSKCGGQMRRASRPGIGRNTGRLNKVLMIARELKGRLKEAFADKSLKDIEIAHLVEKINGHDSEINKVKLEIETATKQMELYKENASEILTRRNTLGDFAKDMNDEQILNEKDYEIATLRKEVAEKDVRNIETATETISTVISADVMDKRTKEIRDGINKYAFDNIGK